jgi:tRNA pseudouridine55 synthase
VKPARRAVTGILLLDKPAGISSNRALQQAKRLFNADKAGHTGSLDPLATGLLPICFGEATKIAGYLLGSRKAYAAQCRLGATTTTDDAEGEVVLTRPIPEITDATIEVALATLRGRIVQTPPAYSAIKQGGVPLYKRARRGEDVAVPSREVEVERFDLQDRAGDVLNLHVECGSGTYVRSLARDLGERLGCGAHLIALRRLWVEPFRDPAMHTLESFEQVDAAGGPAALDRLLLPIEAGLGALPALHLDPEQTRRLRHGQRLSLPGQGPQPLGRALDAQGRLIALVRLDADGTVTIVRGFAAPD